MGQRSVLIGDAAFVPVIGRADVQPRQPTERGNITLRSRFAHPGAGQRHLTVLILRKTKNGVESDRQGPGSYWRCAIRGRVHIG